MVTLVFVPLVVCVGSFAPTQRLGLVPTPGATCSPPGVKPFGTFGSCKPGWFGSAPRLFGPLMAAARAADCMFFTALSAWLVRASVSVPLGAPAWTAAA